MDIIELDENGLAYVPISVKPKDRHIHRQIPFKLDTAAGITTISKKSLKQLGYDDAWSLFEFSNKIHYSSNIIIREESPKAA